MIKAVIIDDEKHSIENLQWKLGTYCPDVEVIASFDRPEKGLNYLKRNKLDLLFLDIEMPMLGGFDILEELGGKAPFEVIFTTAYDSYGIRALKYNALDYLLKPVRNKELTEAIDRFKQRNKTKHSSHQIKSLLSNLRSERKNRRHGRITLATKESLELVDPQDIIFCASDSNYTMVHLSDGRKKLISRTLRDFEEMLAPYNFYRPHHSFLVNMALVREYKKGDGGYLVLRNKTKIPVSKSKRERLLNYF